MAGGAFPLTAKGSDVTGVPAALAIVGLAALVAVFAVRSSGRFLVSALLALSGAGTVRGGGARRERQLRPRRRPRPPAATPPPPRAPSATPPGPTRPRRAARSSSSRGCSRCATDGCGPRCPAARRDGTPRPRKAKPVDPSRPEDIWKALDRGEDPTGPDPAGTSDRNQAEAKDRNGQTGRALRPGTLVVTCRM